MHDLFTEVADEVEKHPSRYAVAGKATPRSSERSRAKKAKLIQKGMEERLREIIDGREEDEG